MNPLTTVARKLGTQAWFSRAGQAIVSLDLAVLRRTSGRIGVLRLAGLPSLLLTATGRRTGQSRSVALLYVPHSQDYLVVGSNWGGARHPAWSVNLRANPDATVTERGRVIPVRARQVTGEERERLWREVITPTWPAYDEYARRAGDREIRVFALHPRDGRTER